MITDNYQIIDNGDAALSIIFDEPISEQLTYKIIQLAEQMRLIFDEELENIIPGYQSLTLCYPATASYERQLRQSITNLLSQELPPLEYQPRLITIPVCYEDDYAPDIDLISSHTGLSHQEIIEKHSSHEYLVHMLGFLPGFLYLGGMNNRLSCPRKTTPSININAGSVGIGGSQTGIYPVSSPGGWNIIGRTPLQLFTPNTEHPYIARALDKVKFKPISSSEYLTLATNSGEQT